MGQMMCRPDIALAVVLLTLTLGPAPGRMPAGRALLGLVVSRYVQILIWYRIRGLPVGTLALMWRTNDLDQERWKHDSARYMQNSLRKDDPSVSATVITSEHAMYVPHILCANSSTTHYGVDKFATLWCRQVCTTMCAHT